MDTTIRRRLVDNSETAVQVHTYHRSNHLRPTTWSGTTRGASSSVLPQVLRPEQQVAVKVPSRHAQSTFSVGSPGGPASRGPWGADTTKLALDKKFASLDQVMYDENDVFTLAKFLE